MPSLPHRPALASRDGISSFSSVQSSDSYYSNAEIRVLHDVVAVAQDNLDDLPEGERLATNALFQAYDAVLPNYGIDPEEDHHISRLVFRVGGERGDGSLLEKLHNVLSRMGIELEFDNPSDGSRPVSDQCDEAEREMASQPSRPFSDAGHDSVTTEDESSENFQLPQEDRHKSSSASFDSDRHPCPPRLTRTALAPNLSAHGSGQQREEPISRSYSPPTAAGTEQTRQSSQLGVDTSGNRGPNGATVRPVDTVAPYPEENENLASSLPVRTKPVRTVNWLLPEDAADTEPSNGHGSVTTEHRAQSQSSQQQYQLYKQPQQSQQYQHRLLQQQHIPNEHDGRSMPSHLYQSYQKVEELEQEQRVSQQQHSLYHSLPQIRQVLPQQAVPQQENANEPKLQQQPFREYQHPQQANQPPYVPVIEHQIQHAQFQQDQQELVSAGSVPDHDAIQHKEDSSAGRRQKAEELSSSDVKDFRQEATNNEQQLAEKPPETEPELDVRGVSADEEMEEDPEAEARYAWLERRTARAARYLQLLRGLSHWETYAMEKRERTAVARRHILRMRHFDPWELVTADAKLKGRRIFISRLLALWIRRVDECVVMDNEASAIAQCSPIKRVLAAWSGSCPTPAGVPSQPRLISACLQQWQRAASSFQALSAHVGQLSKNFAKAQVSNLWHHQILHCHTRVAAFRRLGVIRDSLSHWQLETKVEVFRAKMGFKLIRNALSRWDGACRSAPSGFQTGLRTTKRQDAQAGQLLSRSALSTTSPMAISHRMLKTKVLDVWHRQSSTAARTSTRSRRFAAHQAVQRVLDSWQVEVDQGRSLSTWSQRGRFYVGVNAAVKNWRSKGTWRSHTRKAYARCRQHVKATTAKKYMTRWKSTARVHENIDWEVSKHNNAIGRNGAIIVLTAWQNESCNDRGSSRLLTNAWLSEWHIMSRDHDGVQSRSMGAWEENLKSRYWGQWQSTLLQLKSREYVASDVRERNRKKLVRRLLLHWKGDRGTGSSQPTSAMRASLGASRRGAGIVSNGNSFQLSRAVHDRPAALLKPSRLQEFGPTVEEEEHDGGGVAADADGVVVNTPTRWTGMASSVRLPSMTPFAPLPTPFERELRERYNRSMPPASNGQLSKLSFAQAQRLSAAEVNARRTTNDGRPGPLGRGANDGALGSN